MEELKKIYPTRTPVWWARRGLVELNRDELGVTGRLVVIRIWKESRNPKGFGRIFYFFENLMFKLMNGPRELRRNLDDMNSLLWELSDGTRTFEEICVVMDEVFAEHISPVEERTAIALKQFESLGFLLMLNDKFDGSWPNGPGVKDPKKPLPKPDEKLDLDVSLYGDENSTWK